MPAAATPTTGEPLRRPRTPPNRTAEQEQIEPADRAEHDLEEHHERAEDDQSPVQSVHVPHANPPRASGQGGAGATPVARSENGQRGIGTRSRVRPWKSTCKTMPRAAPDSMPKPATAPCVPGRRATTAASSLRSRRRTSIAGRCVQRERRGARVVASMRPRRRHKRMASGLVCAAVPKPRRERRPGSALRARSHGRCG